jgi:hypothetical protein
MRYARPTAGLRGDFVADSFHPGSKISEIAIALLEMSGPLGLDIAELGLMLEVLTPRLRGEHLERDDIARLSVLNLLEDKLKFVETIVRALRAQLAPLRQQVSALEAERRDEPVSKEARRFAEVIEKVRAQPPRVKMKHA